LKDAEEKAGKILLPGMKITDITNEFNGIPETVEFWREETKRLEFNKDYLDRARAQLGLVPASNSNAAQNPSLHVVSRLVVSVSDVEREARFWCEVCGMQRYGKLADGSIIVAYGPPGVAEGDEGMFFALEITPAVATPAPNESMATSGARLSFIQIRTPVQLRQYKIDETGGEDLGGYGYYYMKSPSGIVVRAYVGDRRDPVEFVVLTADAENYAPVRKQLEALGLEAADGYSRANEYMPRLPYPNKTFVGGDPDFFTQVLLLPFQAEQPTLYNTSQSLDKVLSNDDADEMVEKPFSPVSTAQGVRLVTFAPKAQVPKREAGTTTGRAGVTFEVRPAADLG